MHFRTFTITYLASCVVLLTIGFSTKSQAKPLTVHEMEITDYRPVVARLESSDTAIARARISGVVTKLSVDEGVIVKKGQLIALIRDESLNPQIAALSAKITGIKQQLAQYKTDLARAEKLYAKGFVAPSKVDQARTTVDVTEKQLSAVISQRAALIAQQSKGRVYAPADAHVTAVNVVKGSTVSPGQAIAHLATLDGVVRLALPERHAGAIHDGEVLTLRLPGRGGKTFKAKIAKIYPELRGGAVIADAKIDGRLNALVGERVDVLIALGKRRALLIPKSYITTRYGIDFVKVHVGKHILEAPVTLADPNGKDGEVEILAGLHDGDVIETPGE